MIATSDFIEILNKSEQIGHDIMRSEIAHKYIACKQRLAEDETAQKLISQFVAMKETYEEVQRFGKYHPDYTTISDKMRKVKRELDLNESVANYKQAEEEMELLLNEISAIIAGAVSPLIKVPTGNPFFDNLRCQGGCASGSGCAC